MKHIPVLLKESIKYLNLKPEGIYVDATLGLGGHSEEIAKIVTNGTLICFDKDEEAINFSKKRLERFTNIIFINDSFKNLEKHLNLLKITEINGIIYDLGTNYYQLTSLERGFSYHGENIELDMRMDRRQELTALKVLNSYSKEQLNKIFRNYGEEKRSLKLAEAILEARQKKEIRTNTELNKIIKSIKGFNSSKHPSKNIYQAIRIEVNKEISDLEDSLNMGIKFLKPEGRILVITFHSLEDRIVKELFWSKKQEQMITPFFIKRNYRTLKTIYPKKEELIENKSAKSAKLRILQKEKL